MSRDQAEDGFSVGAHQGCSLSPGGLLDVLERSHVVRQADMERRVLVYDPRHQTDGALRRLSWCFGGRELIAVPMLAQHEMVGLILLGGRGPRLKKSATDQAHLLAAASIAGLAWQHLQSEQQLRALEVARQVLAAAVGGAESDLQGLLERIAREAVRLLEIDAAAVLLPEPATGDFVVQAQAGLGAASIGRARLPSASAGELGVDGANAAPLDRQMGLFAGEHVPAVVQEIRLQKKTLGLLYAYHRSECNRFRSYVRHTMAALSGEMAALLAATTGLHTNQELEERLRQLIQHDTNFTRLLSHQLRTPLTSIRGFAQLILRHPYPNPDLVRSYVSIIFDKTGHLIDTIEEVRGLAAVTSDLLALKKEPLFILPLVRQVVASVEPFSRHLFELSLPAKTALVRADQERISQIVNSLICNAMRRSASGLPIHVGVEESSDCVVVWVGDRGPALSQQERESVFDWGQPADDLIEDGGVRANSLALYACKQLVQAHGGRMWVESEADETRFCFTLCS